MVVSEIEKGGGHRTFIAWLPNGTLSKGGVFQPTATLEPHASNEDCTANSQPHGTIHNDTTTQRHRAVRTVLHCTARYN